MDILSLNKKMAGGGSGVIVHIIDTGINPIPELAGVLTVVPFRGDAQGGGTSGTLSPGKTEIDYSDHMGHGTMMASAAHRQAPKALIYAYNALPDGVQVYANEALAHVLGIVKADKTHRHIVSISASGDLSRITTETMHSLIKQLVALDCPVVCAAGNDGKEALTLYPACFPEPITVVAVKNDGTHAEFSNWLGEADFAEIGKAVPCCDKDGRETTVDGTSPATACVAGKLAAMWSRDLGMTEPQLYEAAKANAQDMGLPGRDPYFGWGWIAGLEVAAVTPGTDLKPETPNKEDVMTAAQLIAYFQRAVDEGWGYVWSLNGELYTREKAEYYHKIQKPTNSNRDPKTYWLTVCAKWIGKMAADCSGGIVGAIRTVIPGYDDRNANTFYAQCTEKGPIKTIPEIPGLCVWRDGHIGIYEGNGNVLEFRGADYGAVRTKLKDRNFTNWGRLRDINYTKETDMAKIITKNLAYDADVQALQTALNALGYDCGTADGKAGDKTMAGISAFCAAHGAGGGAPEAAQLRIVVGDTQYVLEGKAVRI